MLFVLLPFALAAVVIPLVAWRASKGPRPVLTSEILAAGVPAEARIVSVRRLGGLFDVKPMLRLSVRVNPLGGEADPFDLEIYQSFPRSVVGEFKPDTEVQIRFLADRSAGAIVWSAGPMG